MMHRSGIRFKATCETKAVLVQVKENRQKHAQMVAEARAGYLREARKELARRIAQIDEGKFVSLAFQIPVPRDHTSVYDSAIAMLTAHQEAVVVLEADEFRNLMQDEWEWTSEFALINAAYSDGTRAWAAGKGVDVGHLGGGQVGGGF